MSRTMIRADDDGSLNRMDCIANVDQVENMVLARKCVTRVTNGHGYWPTEHLVEKDSLWEDERNRGS